MKIFNPTPFLFDPLTNKCEELKKFPEEQMGTHFLQHPNSTPSF
jgi:hypothetical protein